MLHIKVKNMQHFNNWNTHACANNTVAGWGEGAFRTINARLIPFKAHTVHEMDWYSRLWLGRVVAQGNGLPLDLVETFLAKVVPVSKKPKFWWTTPFPKAQSVIDSAREGSHQLVQDMGRVGCHKRSKQEVEAQHSRKSSSQQPVMILRGGDEGMCLEVHGWSSQKQANVDITTIGREDGQVIWTGNRTRQTSKTTHSREPRQSTY